MLLKLKNLMLQKSPFQWTDMTWNVYNDGPTMLKVILDSINPLTRVRLFAFKAWIEKATLGKLGNDVKKILK